MGSTLGYLKQTFHRGSRLPSQRERAGRPSNVEFRLPACETNKNRAQEVEPVFLPYRLAGIHRHLVFILGLAVPCNRKSNDARTTLARWKHNAMENTYPCPLLFGDHRNRAKFAFNSSRLQ